MIAASGDSGWFMQWDSDGDGALDQHMWSAAAYTEWPCWVRLERSGDSFTGSYSTDNLVWDTLATVQVPGSSGARDVGMFAASAAGGFFDFTVAP